MDTRYYGWALTEPADLTAVSGTTVLFARVAGPGALTVEATEDGELLINGRAETLAEADMTALCERADVVLAGRPRIGTTIRVGG